MFDTLDFFDYAYSLLGPLDVVVVLDVASQVCGTLLAAFSSHISLLALLVSS